MTQSELHAQISRLEKRYRVTPADQRARMRPQVQQIIRHLKDQRLPLPAELRRIQTRLEQDAFDDMFDNLPV